MKININKNEYFDHPYNGTITNERAVEVEFGKRYLEEFKDVIEIGAVMPYYGYSDHTIYDPYDEHPHNIKEYAENLNIEGKNVLSISTIEHMGETYGHGSAFEAQQPQAAANFLEKLLNLSNSFLVTLPVGCNPYLDDYLKHNLNKYTWFGFEKVAQDPVSWIQNNTLSIYNHQYGYPYPAANGLIILIKNIKLD